MTVESIAPAETAEPTPELPAETADRPNDVKALEVALRKANKEAEQTRLKLKELEDRDKTEAQRLADLAESHKADAVKATAELTRIKVALRYQIPESDLDLLGDGDEEQIEARAKRLAELRAAAESTTPGPPRGDVDQGVRTQALPLNGDPLEQALKRKLGVAD